MYSFVFASGIFYISACWIIIDISYEAWDRYGYILPALIISGCATYGLYYDSVA